MTKLSKTIQFIELALHWTLSIFQLLTYTIAHVTKPFFRLKTNNQPTKKFLSLAGHLSKSHQNVQNSDFQCQFSMSKIIQMFLKYFFNEDYYFRSTFFENFNF